MIDQAQIANTSPGEKSRLVRNRPNILFSTTRQWNCGDEFIMFGARRLLSAVGLDYNPIIYNRHPSIQPQRYTRPRRWSRSEPLPQLDNSFFLNDDSLIDYVVFAGSPEWFGGPRVRPLLRFILERGLRCCFLGVGVHKHQEFGDELRQVLHEHTDLITARDPICYEMIREYPNSYQEVCPALFASPVARRRTDLREVGFVIQAAKTQGHSLSDAVHEGCLRQLQSLEDRFPVTCIAHYVDDLRLALETGREALYSGYSEDYPSLYDRFDVVISTRIHGCGLASSLGIPNGLVPHDGRFTTALGFGSTILSLQQDWGVWLKELDISEASAALLCRREVHWKRYLDLLRTHLSIGRQARLSN